jgi:septal ring factor EnvC (AmiA/AmiB activator)
MLTASKLEQIIELENNLKGQYQVKIDAQTAQIASLVKEREVEEAVTLKVKEDQQAVIAKQLEQITTLSKEASASKRVEQLHRELTSRAEKMQNEITEQKKRVKTLQKDLATEREELKALKQFDPAKMKKNLDAAKKKAAEKQTANDLMQKTLSKTKTEKGELEQKVKELEEKLAAFEEAEEAKEETKVETKVETEAVAA